MPSNPISSMMTLVIPLFFVLAVLTAPPGAAGAREVAGPEPAGSIGGRLRNEPVLGACTGSFCGLTRPAPLRVGDGVSPLDPEFCEYVGPAPFFVSPSDSEFCGLVSPAPLALPSAAVE